MAYSPIVGRWLEADPAGYVDGENLYQLERSNPVASTDATGLMDTPRPFNGIITNELKDPVLIWQDPNTYKVLDPGQSTPSNEDWDYVKLPNGKWYKVGPRHIYLHTDDETGKCEAWIKNGWLDRLNGSPYWEEIHSVRKGEGYPGNWPKKPWWKFW